MLYELRVYHCIPGRLPDLLKRFDTITTRIWQRHGIEQAGFWTVAIGDSNQTLYYFLKWELVGRPREEMGRLPGRSGMDQRAGGDREERRHRRPRRKPDPATDQLFGGEVTFSPRRHGERGGEAISMSSVSPW